MSDQRWELLVVLGDDDCDAALDWAVAHALRLGLDLRLVFAAQPRGDLGGADSLLLTFDAGDDAGRSVPTAAGTAAVVIGHSPRGYPRHPFGGAKAAEVAGQAYVPVVSVPDTWAPSRAEPGRAPGVAPRVTVGVADVDDADALIGYAIQTAAQAGCCLTLLHAWHVPAVYELGLLPPEFESGWVEEETRFLNHLADSWRREHPEIEIETRLVRGRPERVLVDASRASNHLIVGRPHSPAHHDCSVATALLRESACPVGVLPT